MTETAARKPRPRRTFSAFGDVRRMPSDYEIVTHRQKLDPAAEPAVGVRAEPVVAREPVVPHLPRPVAAAGRGLGELP